MGDGIPSDGNTPTMCAPGTKDENRTDCFDATQEETFHMITDNGFANVYPEIFACHRSQSRTDYGPPYSELHKTMIGVIGDCGYAYKHSMKKSCHGSYHYSDVTCKPDCMMTEYTYSAMTTVLGW